MRDAFGTQDDMRDNDGKGHRGDRQIQTLQAQRRYPDYQTEGGCHQSAGGQTEPQWHTVVGRQDRRRIATDRQKSGLAELNQTRRSGQEIETDDPHRRNHHSVDQGCEVIGQQ